jgi:hypothetical protein
MRRVPDEYSQRMDREPSYLLAKTACLRYLSDLHQFFDYLEEADLVASNRELIERFEKKIQAAIARVWVRRNDRQMSCY